MHSCDLVRLTLFNKYPWPGANGGGLTEIMYMCVCVRSGDRLLHCVYIPLGRRMCVEIRFGPHYWTEEVVLLRRPWKWRASKMQQKLSWVQREAVYHAGNYTSVVRHVIKAILCRQSAWIRDAHGEEDIRMEITTEPSQIWPHCLVGSTFCSSGAGFCSLRVELWCN